MTDDGLTAGLARFVAHLRFEDLPREVVEQARRVLLDAVGCALGAYEEDERKVGVIGRLVEQFGAPGQATILGGARSHATVAAFANGFLINATDNDDTHKRALLHTGSVVVPAALAVTEASDGNGKDLLVAIVAGYEVAVRVGMAVMPTHYRFWHSTATNGHFGAAAAAARAFGLDEQGVRTALGFAGTQAAGLNTFFESGDDSKSVHPGKAGLDGVLSAMLAQAQASSPPDVLGHPKGYLAAYSAEPKPECILQGLGRTWEILDNGFKFYPSILASHSPIGACLEIVSREPLPVEEIESVRIDTYATVKSHFSSKAVQTEMAARLSVPYCVAIALIDGQVTQAQFSSARFTDPAVRRLLEKVEVVVDPDLSPLYPEKFPARVIVTMRGGDRREATFLYPKGDPANPLTPEEFLGKFRRNVDGAKVSAASSAILEAVGRLEEMRVAAFTRLLRPDDR